MNNEQCKNCPLIEELKILRARIEELEKQLAEALKKLEKYEKPPKNSSNSSMPPSSDKNKKYYPPREKSGKKPGGQLGHKGYAKMLYDNPDNIVEIYPQKCFHCGNDHFDKKENILEQRQIIDIPEIKPYITEYQQKAGICTCCGKRNIGKFPENIVPNVQIGERTKGLIGYFNVTHNVSYERLIQIFSDIFNLEMSKGTIDNKLKELSKNLKPEYEKILENLKKSDVIGSDETGIRINGKNAYLWTFQNEENTFYTNTFSRAFQVIEDTIGKYFNGSWVSDRYAAQLKIKANHQFCIVHLIRECKYIIQAEDSEWARDLKDFFERAIEFRKEKRNDFDILDIEIFREIQRLRNELNEIFANPPPKTEESRLYRQLYLKRKELIHFLENPKVPYDNNGSERALRNRVIRQKVLGGFRSSTGANVHDIIASVIETVKKRGLNILETIYILSIKNQQLLQA
jgi:transposase